MPDAEVPPAAEQVELPETFSRFVPEAVVKQIENLANGVESVGKMLAGVRTNPDNEQALKVLKVQLTALSVLVLGGFGIGKLIDAITTVLEEIERRKELDAKMKMMEQHMVSRYEARGFTIECAEEDPIDPENEYRHRTMIVVDRAHTDAVRIVDVSLQTNTDQGQDATMTFSEAGSETVVETPEFDEYKMQEILTTYCGMNMNAESTVHIGDRLMRLNDYMEFQVEEGVKFERSGGEFRMQIDLDLWDIPKEALATPPDAYNRASFVMDADMVVDPLHIPENGDGFNLFKKEQGLRMMFGTYRNDQYQYAGHISEQGGNVHLRIRRLGEMKEFTMTRKNRQERLQMFT